MDTNISFISSANNVQLKLIRKLSSRKGRKETGLFLAEGERLVREVCRPWIMRTLVMTQDYYQQRNEIWKPILEQYPDVHVLIVPETIFAGLADTEHPQGILAAVEMREYSLDKVLNEAENPFLVVLENLQDPGNAGTILRTADAAKADAVLCSAGTVDFYAPKTVRASMGSIFHIPVLYSEDFSEMLTKLKERRIHLLAAHLKGNHSLFEADLKHACAILIGNEGNGLTDETAGTADELVRIPQPGRAESLNASVAAGIFIYEAVRQRIKP